MGMLTSMATEGGRKCPMCGRYAKSRELGWLGFNSPNLCVGAYGHLPGKGCNKKKKTKNGTN